MCKFNLPFSGDAESLTLRAKAAIERAGGSFTGNVTQGNFRAKTPLGSIHGTYQVAGEQVILAINKKPLFLTCARIEKELSQVMR